jgi:signal transduction histidine kinase
LAVTVIALAGPALLLFLILGSQSDAVGRFRLEFLLLLAAGATTSAVELLAASTLFFWVVHAIHGCLVLVMVQILATRSGIAELLIVVPLVLETAIYLDFVPGLAFNGMVGAVIVGSDLTRLAHGPHSAILPHLLLVPGIVVCVGWLATLAGRYREWIVHRDQQITAITDTMANLSNANQAFQSYAGTVESASATKERNRITRELHDTVGYVLTNVIMSMTAAKVLAKDRPSSLPELLENTRTQAEDALSQTRRILHELREVREPSSEGLKAIFHMSRSFQEATGVAVDVHYGNLPFSLGPHIDEAIERLVQEGLTNSLRHGKATRVRIKLWQTESEIQISLRDDGMGIGAIVEGIGLKGMRERLEFLGGYVNPHNVEDGFELIAGIPFKEGGAYGQD